MKKNGLVAGLDLDRLRAAGVMDRSPENARGALAPFEKVHRAVLAWTGTELLILGRGTIPGAVQVKPDLALAGATGLVDWARREHQAAPIVAVAEPIAREAIDAFLQALPRRLSPFTRFKRKIQGGLFAARLARAAKARTA